MRCPNELRIKNADLFVATQIRNLTLAPKDANVEPAFLTYKNANLLDHRLFKFQIYVAGTFYHYL